jgi:hypothetical protein
VKRYLISNNHENLALALQAVVAEGGQTATVEAEYGDFVVEGSRRTLAHHGPRTGQKAPCSYGNELVDVKITAVGLSHIDLDTIGGCLALEGMMRPGDDGFWRLAEFVDLNGPHKLAFSGACDEDIARLYAYWAFSAVNRIYPERDGTVSDVTEKVQDHFTAVLRILRDDKDYLAEGATFRAAEAKLNTDSYVSEHVGVVVRVSTGFVNHLYTTPSGYLGKAVVAFNTHTGALTVSLADPITGVSCVTIMQQLFGLSAGGHQGIAGSPRGQRMSLFDMAELVDTLRQKI